MQFSLATSLAILATAASAAFTNGTSSSAVPSGIPSGLTFVPFSDDSAFGFLLSVPGNYCPFSGAVDQTDITFDQSYVDFNDAPADSDDYTLSETDFGYNVVANASDVVDVALLGAVPGPGTYSATIEVVIPTAAARRVKRADETYTLSATITVTSSGSSTPSVTSTTETTTEAISTATFTVTSCSDNACSDVTITTTVPCDYSTVTYTVTSCSNGACSGVETSGIATEIYTVIDNEIQTIYTTVPCTTETPAPVAPVTAASTEAAISTYEGAAAYTGANGLALGAFVAGLLLI